ncbi:MAG TPA: hypothetical protein VF708_08680 [Pyrinomonadaceae bacterium]|jgi:O-antigen/teichoic acid export membrane protein
MSRKRKALITAGFSYTQFALAMASGILLIPLILSHLGAKTYGLWLASGELLAYTSVLDLGVFAVLPWMIAEADGRGDRSAMRSLITRGLFVGLIVGVALGGICLLSWIFLPSLLKLTTADSAALKGPLALLITTTALVYPLRVFNAVLAGLQDAAFNGMLAVSQLVLSIALTLSLLLTGYGLFSLAVAAAFPSLFAGIAGLWRIKTIAPDLLRGWSWPRLTSIASLFGGGVGTWFGGFGWQLVAASSSLVIAYLGHPEWVPIYACTMKFSQLLMQVSWLLPDSGLVGLAQLHGEGSRERVRQVVGTMLQLYLVLSGAAACAILALNPGFVRLWVGPNLFGGLTLNALFAIGLIWLSLIHGLICSSAVLGNRLRVGMAQLVNGILYLILAVWLGRRWGLGGIALATLLSSGLTTLPFGAWLLKSVIGLELRWLVLELFGRWFLRIVPLLAVAYVLGAFGPLKNFLWLGFVGLMLGLGYLWWMKPHYQSLLLDQRLTRLLSALRLPTGLYMSKVVPADKN